MRELLRMVGTWHEETTFGNVSICCIENRKISIYLSVYLCMCMYIHLYLYRYLYLHLYLHPFIYTHTHTCM